MLRVGKPNQEMAMVSLIREARLDDAPASSLGALATEEVTTELRVRNASIDYRRCFSARSRFKRSISSRRNKTPAVCRFRLRQLA
jgi:hypothetical protein